MADQDSNAPRTQEMIDAISRAELLLMSDENDHHPLLDDMLNGLVEDHCGNVFGNHGTNLQSICSGGNLPIDENGEYTTFPETLAFGNPIRNPVWPVPPSPHSCTCCQTLREFFHTNGNHVLKLHIHGRLGLISHAVMEKYNTDMSSESHECCMFDFCEESISHVKQFLVQYCDDRKREGYIMLQDPLSKFYDTLCTGLDGNSSPDVENFPQQILGGDEQMRREGGLNQLEEEGNGVRVPKSHIASQRERSGKMKLKDLRGYFHLPISVASKELNICSSAIKSICRKGGMERWPYRKVQSINTEISKKQQGLNSSDAYERQRALREMEELQRRLDKIYQAQGG